MRRPFTQGFMRSSLNWTFLSFAFVLAACGGASTDGAADTAAQQAMVPETAGPTHHASTSFSYKSAGGVVLSGGTGSLDTHRLSTTAGADATGADVVTSFRVSSSATLPVNIAVLTCNSSSTNCPATANRSKLYTLHAGNNQLVLKVSAYSPDQATAVGKVTIKLSDMSPTNVVINQALSINLTSLDGAGSTGTSPARHSSFPSVGTASIADSTTTQSGAAKSMIGTSTLSGYRPSSTSTNAWVQSHEQVTMTGAGAGQTSVTMELYGDSSGSLAQGPVWNFSLFPGFNDAVLMDVKLRHLNGINQPDGQPITSASVDLIDHTDTGVYIDQNFGNLNF